MDSKKDVVRVALVGLGGHGRTIQQAVAEAGNLHVVAVYDPDAAEVRAAVDRFGCDVAASYEALLARSDLDAVSIVTPNHVHRQQAEAAFAAGLHVFVEKPIANTVADGLAMIQAAEAAGRVLMVGHNMRFGDAVRQARQAIAAGRLGQIATVEIHFSSDTIKHLAGDAWRLRPDQCPLLPVMQLGIHGIDLVHDLLGPIREVHALTRSVVAPPGVVDSVTAVFQIEDGPLGTLTSNYATPVRFEYRIAGTEGILQCTPHRYWFRKIGETNGFGDGPAEEHDYTARPLESYTRQMRAFWEAVVRGQTPEVDGWAGVQALAVVEALQRSAETRTPQRVPDLSQRSVEQRTNLLHT